VPARGNSICLVFTFDGSDRMTPQKVTLDSFRTFFKVSYPINVLHPKFQSSLSAVAQCKQDPMFVFPRSVHAPILLQQNRRIDRRNI
jgi:hypothetical protein